MSKFSNLLAGTRKRKRVQLPLISGDPVDVDLRMLTPLETVAVIEGATEFARTRKAAEIADGNAIYDLGIQVHTLAVAVVDPEVPDREVPFFDGGVEQILSSQLLARDAIAWLFAMYEQHVDEFALARSELTEDGMRQLIESSAEGDLIPFSKLRPTMQWIFVRSMAALLRISLKASSSSGSGSGSKANGIATESDESAESAQE